MIDLRHTLWVAFTFCITGVGPVLAADTIVSVHRYVLTTELDQFETELQLTAGAAIELVTDPSFIPEPLPGFGAAYGNVRAVTVNETGQSTIMPGADDASPVMTVAPGDWIGIRNRFHTGLIKASGNVSVQIMTDGLNRPRLRITAVDEQAALSFVFYAGPIENQRLRDIDSRLTGMLFSALWDWLRALCFGMLWLLEKFVDLTDDVGIGIVMLSVAVKVLMSPLTHIADRLQDSVNRTQALLQPQLDVIKRDYKGEEAHNRTLAVYKEHGVHPLYTLRSLAGFLIQIPIFIAAFDMLGENVALDQASFLWIEDLARPDSWIDLPLNLPFFGSHLNLLPVLMTGVTVLTSWAQTDPALTPELLHRQRQRLYLMAGAFFVLFYTFPAGMVLYWTTNNVLHFLKIKLLPPKMASA